MLKRTLAASTALAMGVCASQAWAQATPADRGAALQEIVVTAQRRQEALVDVPISVSAVTPEQLQLSGVKATTDLARVVPGLVWGRSTNFQQPTIRGIGSRSPGPGNEPNVAVYIDGVYQPESIGTMFELSNVERVEVLKGPQGTLFGRNATGGAISIITRRPTFDWTGSLEGTYGSFNYYKVSGDVSGPIIHDVLAFSLAATNFGDGGYVRNLYLNEDTGHYDGTAVRGKLLYQATPTLNFTLGGLYSYSSSNVLLSFYSINGNNQARQSAPGTALGRILNPTNIPLSQLVTSEPWTTVVGQNPYGKVKQWFIDGHGEWDLGFATLSGLLSWGRIEGRSQYPSDDSPLVLALNTFYNPSDARNQELILTSNGGGRFTWIVGGTGFEEESRFDPTATTNKSTTTPGVTTTSISISGTNTRSYAFFGEATYELIDHLFITGGLRYNHDVKIPFSKTLVPGTTVYGRGEWDNVSPRGVIRWEFANQANAYFSYTEGFKSGTFSASSLVLLNTPVNPEKVKAYEVGVKAHVNPDLRVEAAAYHYDYTNLQVSTLVQIGGVASAVLMNAGVAKINGVELTAEARLAEGLFVNAGLSVMDTEFTSFPNAVVQTPRTAANGDVLNNGNVTAVVDLTGKQLMRAPKSTLSVSATYEHDLYDGLIQFNANAYVSSKYFGDISNRLVQPSYKIVNASVTWRQSRDRGVYVRFFGQNLTDEVYALGHNVSGFVDGSQADKPRWFGGTVGYEF
jgi:iron complex outermembrane receptor protein